MDCLDRSPLVGCSAETECSVRVNPSRRGGCLYGAWDEKVKDEQDERERNTVRR